jgi:hypothetical protein
MGQAKHEIMKAEERNDLALSIARRAGVLDFCAHHGVSSQSGGDIEDAYKLGNTLFTSGEVSGQFESRREMTDAIKNAVESCAHECYDCSDFRDRD